VVLQTFAANVPAVARVLIDCAGIGRGEGNAAAVLFGAVLVKVPNDMARSRLRAMPSEVAHRRVVLRRKYVAAISQRALAASR